MNKNEVAAKAIRDFMAWATPEEHKGQVTYRDGIPSGGELLEVSASMRHVAEGYNACRSEFVLNAEEYIKKFLTSPENN